jgi:hypothetical protein
LLDVKEIRNDFFLRIHLLLATFKKIIIPMRNYLFDRALTSQQNPVFLPQRATTSEIKILKYALKQKEKYIRKCK